MISITITITITRNKSTFGHWRVNHFRANHPIFKRHTLAIIPHNLANNQINLPHLVPVLLLIGEELHHRRHIITNNGIFDINLQLLFDAFVKSPLILLKLFNFVEIELSEWIYCISAILGGI